MANLNDHPIEGRTVSPLRFIIRFNGYLAIVSQNYLE